MLVGNLLADGLYLQVAHTVLGDDGIGEDLLGDQGRIVSLVLLGKVAELLAVLLLLVA